MIYMVFLFLVAVVMLNLLIAQFNKRYEEVTKSARKSVTIDRAKILVDQHLSRWIRPCCARTILLVRTIKLVRTILLCSHYCTALYTK